MNKKAQAGFMERQLVELAISAIVIVLLFILLMAFIGIFNNDDIVSNDVRDLKRIAVEIEDLIAGETMTVPVLSSGFKILIMSMDDLYQAGVATKCNSKDGNYCGCIYDDNKIKECTNIKVRGEIEFNNLNSELSNDPIDLSETILISKDTNNRRIAVNRDLN